MTGKTADPYRDFRPRRGRIVAAVMAIGLAAIFIYAAWGISEGGAAGWTRLDRIVMGLFGVALGWFVSRWATVKAVVDENGITVRNLFTTRQLLWSEVVGVHFGGGPPWLTLDLADLGHVAVMAIQRADGPYAVEEAGRMAALVSVHSAEDPHEN